MLFAPQIWNMGQIRNILQLIVQPLVKMEWTKFYDVYFWPTLVILCIAYVCGMLCSLSALREETEAICFLTAIRFSVLSRETIHV